MNGSREAAPAPELVRARRNIRLAVSNAPTHLGIDEAGRGSVFGPLVVGGFVCDRERLGELSELGVRDSKQLSPARRRAIYSELGTVGRILSCDLDPAEIDRWVGTGGLNRLEARAFARIVRRAGASAVFVDACDVDAERFGRSVRALSGSSAPIVSRHRADEEIPVVAAASIVAKVERDRAIERLEHTHGPGLGSGYPSDSRTVAFLSQRIAQGGPTPDWVRSSWATTRRIIEGARVRPLERFAP